MIAHLGQSPGLKIDLLNGERVAGVNLECSDQLNAMLAEKGCDTQLILYDGVHLVLAQLNSEVVIEFAAE